MDPRVIAIRLKEFFPIPRILRITNTLLVILLIWIAGMGISRVVEHTVFVTPYQRPRFIPKEKRVIDRTKSISEFDPIIENNVFDAEVEREVEIRQPVVTTTKTPGINLQQILSNLTLIGTVERSKGNNFCVIKDNRKNSEELFAIGEQIFDSGAYIQAIEMDPEEQRVIVSYNGETGLLTLARLDEKDRPQPPKNESTQNRPPERRPLKASTSQPVLNDYTTDGKNFYISSEEVDSELNNFAQLLNQARMVPYFRKGKHQGYQVKAIDKGSLYEKLGLKNRDIIEEINGEALDSMEKVMGLFTRLRNEREFSIKVNRGGTDEFLKYYIN